MTSKITPARIDAITAAYSAYPASTYPTAAQLGRVADLAPGQPVSIVNFFRFREHAAYPDSAPEAAERLSGQEAFQRYAAVSMPTMSEIGGSFGYMAPFAGTFLGADETWDMIVIGNYPDPDTLFRLLENAAYREAYRHRVAALADAREALGAA